MTLSLIVNNKSIVLKHEASSRPFGTFYYHRKGDKDSAYWRRGHAATVVGAIKAAVTALSLGSTEEVVVRDEFDLPIAVITLREGGHILIRRV